MRRLDRSLGLRSRHPELLQLREEGPPRGIELVSSLLHATLLVLALTLALVLVLVSLALALALALVLALALALTLILILALILALTPVLVVLVLAGSGGVRVTSGKGPHVAVGPDGAVALQRRTDARNRRHRAGRRHRGHHNGDLDSLPSFPALHGYLLEIGCTSDDS
ncbi:hypothetical protein BG844_28745 [Couchioplanes caeruleus subsp. caeruleus]|uniref:Uncharacterized protein n=1 Tax=Couchioplanes caeruleus subsp. caeruleus TaxID=56427 RepID=A0A1K0FEG3_9ACTN|nr:hypothetical protein BG844_28745 [Couchioplanes caeruleus subsp. caeruleus]